jgi:hypothetical protein
VKPVAYAWLATNAMTEVQKTFRATVEKGQGKALLVRLPFDPSEVWGEKSKHYVSGTVDGRKIRVPLAPAGRDSVLRLGEAWLRESTIEAGASVDVILWAEGPQRQTLSLDLREALSQEPEAEAFFLGLATFYRKGYVNWIENARRPETRAGRIRKAVELLKAGRRRR